MTTAPARSLIRSVKSFTRRIRAFFSARTAKGKLPVVILGTAEGSRHFRRALNGLKGERSGAREFYVAAVAADGTTPLVRFAGIEHAVIALPKPCTRETEDLFRECCIVFKYLLVVPQFGTPLDKHKNVADVRRSKIGRLAGRDCGEALSKRLLDIAAGLFLGVLSAPILLAAALAIRLDSKGPVFYKHARIGKASRVFTAFKLRTMHADAEERLNEYLARNPPARDEWERRRKLKNDPRITRVGRLLRRLSLDELPQIWNVLAGDMSLVGPRPIVIAEVEKYGQDYAAYERARPGVTGLWQVSGRNDTTYGERVKLDAHYVRNWSLALDARIAVKTLRAVISGEGAY